MFALASQPLAWLRTQERSVIFAVLNIIQGATGPTLIIVLVIGFKMGVAGVVLGDTLGLATVAVCGANRVPQVAALELLADAARTYAAIRVAHCCRSGSQAPSSPVRIVTS